MPTGTYSSEKSFWKLNLILNLSVDYNSLNEVDNNLVVNP